MKYLVRKGGRPVLLPDGRTQVNPGQTFDDSILVRYLGHSWNTSRWFNECKSRIRVVDEAMDTVLGNVEVAGDPPPMPDAPEPEVTPVAPAAPAEPEAAPTEDGDDQGDEEPRETTGGFGTF